MGGKELQFTPLLNCGGGRAEKDGKGALSQPVPVPSLA